MFDEEIQTIAKQLVKQFAEAKRTIATAESCTGGLIGGAITSVSGSSAVYETGFVTYSNEAKIALIDVDPHTLDTIGAVSAETASQMAIGTLEATGANAAVAVTGIAGPTGGTEVKPVGLVFVAIASDFEEGAFVERFEFGSIGREKIRRETVREALEMLIAYGLDRFTD